MAGGFDRSKYRSTTASALQKTKQEQEAKRPSSGYERNILEIKPGDNKFRIFPFHPDSGIDTYSVPKTVSFLSVTKEKRDDNGKKVEGEFEVKRSPVFNGKVHGNLPKDLVEEYMTVAKQIAIPNFTGEKKIQDKIWNIMTYAGKGSKAIKPSDVWVVYAKKEEGKDNAGNSIWGKVGELELKRTIADQLTEKAVEFSGEEVMSPDIYTDPDEGIAIIINKSGEGKDTEYKVRLDTTKQKLGNQFVNASVPSPLTDAELEAFAKLTPLAKKFVGSFKRKDLEFEVEGLKNFDDELAKQGLPINVFGYPEFQDVIDELFDLVPETEETTEAETESESDTPADETHGGAEEEVTAPAPVVVPEKPRAAARPGATRTAATLPPKTGGVASRPTAATGQIKTPTPVAKPVVTPAPVASTGGEDRLAKIKAMMKKS